MQSGSKRRGLRRQGLPRAPGERFHHRARDEIERPPGDLVEQAVRDLVVDIELDLARELAERRDAPVALEAAERTFDEAHAQPFGTALRVSGLKAEADLQIRELEAGGHPVVAAFVDRR